MNHGMSYALLDGFSVGGEEEARMVPGKRRHGPLHGTARNLSPEQRARAIALLEVRCNDLDALRHDKVLYHDSRVVKVESAIRDTIREIFGAESDEYQEEWKDLTLRYHHLSGDRQEGLRVGIGKAWWGLWLLKQSLEEDLGTRPDADRARTNSLFSMLEPHRRISDASANLFHHGHYRNAVLDAYLALESLVKEKARRHDLDGVRLMQEAFNKDNPILAFTDLKDKSDYDEQQGMMFLFMGAAMALRNPRAHTLDSDSPIEALDYIVFLSLLAYRLDEARYVQGP